jgi:hypothetical protein
MRNLKSKQGDGWNYEEIHSGNAVGMIPQEGLPALGRWVPPPRYIFRHAHLPDVDAELKQLAVDPRRPSERVRQAHLAD